MGTGRDRDGDGDGHVLPPARRRPARRPARWPTLGGDDRSVNAAGARTNLADPRDFLLTYLPERTRGMDVLQRLRIVALELVNGPRLGRELFRANCEVAASMATRLGLGAGVETALLHIFEWWNGKGGPRGIAGEEIPVPVRVAQVSSVAVLFHGLGGEQAATTALRQRADGMLDPGVVAVMTRDAHDLLGEVFASDPAGLVLAAEPAPARMVAPPALEEVARAFGQVVDLKSPFLHGHADAVADLAQAAGEVLGLAEAADGRLGLAGLLHDLGRVGVATGVWDSPSPLTVAEWEQVRLHPYHTERILCRSATLEPIATLAGQHHERPDGTGYHRGTAGQAIPMAARVLAAADTWAGLTADRPHRSAHDPEEAGAHLDAAAGAGGLDADAVAAVLAVVTDRPATARRTWPADLTDRQVEVLRLLARGMSNRAIAEELVISRRTAEHHVQDIYARIGVSSRAAATMFAMQHGLLR